MILIVTFLNHIINLLCTFIIIIFLYNYTLIILLGLSSHPTILHLFLHLSSGLMFPPDVESYLDHNVLMILITVRVL